ncbi:MAG: hypothetical protein KJ887_06220 [Candidatus Omnitrophica bacterium]|nr:hypothetical protein [Candidatus Omnitrophota bacterium]MBU1047980.1 hypothetical protein [Candidatus Omnitrophota bacterium]MBU1631382.1 hypothetical protein [Candidatus Omnitrophota bacterium]MBU1766725.1 hypothetical protein [Candidatus Omnitrophota bacterium]MBU1889642.1 hypothetical protein [Candidatus Omnitrophota bacterium]
MKNLLAILLLIVSITIIVRAGEIKPSEVEIKAMVVTLSSAELQKLGIEKTKDNFSPEEFQIIRTKLQTGEIKSNILELPSLRTIDGTQATTKISSLKLEHIFTATPKIDGDIILISMKLQLTDAVRMIKTSTTTQVKNGETALVSGISDLGAEEERLNTMVFVTANIIDSQMK